MPDKAAHIKICAGAISIVLLTGTAAIAADPVGTWSTAAKRAQVRIGHCAGNSLCGGIVKLQEPNDPQTGKPKTDINNPDQANEIVRSSACASCSISSPPGHPISGKATCTTPTTDGPMAAI
jgi:uncharacterized protein (DUF2147 family)